MLRVLLAGAILCVAAFAVGRPQFALRDTRGVVHSPEEWNGKKAIVVFFTTTDCPLSNNEVPEMNRTRRDYEARGVAFYAVQADTTIADADVVQHTKEYQFSFPVLFDPQQILAKMTGATTIPFGGLPHARGDVALSGAHRQSRGGLQRPAASGDQVRSAGGAGRRIGW